jgi:hypothetical protein
LFKFEIYSISKTSNSKFEIVQVLEKKKEKEKDKKRRKRY